MLVLPPPPTISQTRELLSSAHTHLSSQCTAANCVENRFFQNWPKISRVICDVKVVYSGRNFEKTCFSQTLGNHIFVTKRSTDKVKHVLEMPILFFVFPVLLLFEFKLRFQAENAMC
jgi:hypothetical protein